MKILKIEPGKPPESMEIDSSLASMQALYPFSEPVAVICNDEGKLLGLPPNRSLRHPHRDSLGETLEDQDACIARILYFFEKHWDELLKFSRRTQRQLDRWAARYGYKEQTMEILDHAKRGYHGGRYTCVNLQNRDTIEFRIFRGTLKYNTLITTLQLVDRICDAALHLSDEEMKALSWTTSAAGAGAVSQGAAALHQRAGGKRGGTLMCCLFGLMEYKGSLSSGEKSRIINVLARACEVRGIDATGIACNSGGGLRHLQAPAPGPQTADSLFRHPPGRRHRISESGLPDHRCAHANNVRHRSF